MSSVRIVASVMLLHICNGFADTGFVHSATNPSLQRGTSLQSNKSVNNGTGDYHYNQQPRGTSFISQVSKKDLEERRQVRPPFQPQPLQWQTPSIQQQQPIQSPAPAQVQQTQMSNNMKEFDSISANIKAMTNLLGDVKESLTAQTSDIRWLNQKYQEIEKRLERAEIFNTAISQDVSEMKSSKKSTVGQSRFGPIFDEPDPTTTESEYNVRDESSNKGSLHEKLDGIKEQMNRLDIAIKVGEVTLSSHMEDVNRRFDSMDAGMAANNVNRDQQVQQPQAQFNQPPPTNTNQPFNQPQPNMNPQFNQLQPNMNPQFNQPLPNSMSNQFRQPQPPPFEPVQPIRNEPNQPYPGNFQAQVGSFRYEGPRLGRSYEIPSSRQTLPSQSNANYRNQRRNKSFISAISEQELAERRELFEPVAPIFEGPGEYFGGEYDEFYPDEPFLGEGGYYEEGFFGY